MININTNTINKMIKYLMGNTHSFGSTKRKEPEVDEWESRTFIPKKDPRGVIKAKIESNVEYSQLNVGDEVIARFFPTSQRDIEYSSTRRGTLIFKDPEDPTKSILELENGEKVFLFDRTDVTGLYTYDRMVYSINYKKLMG